MASGVPALVVKTTLVLAVAATAAGCFGGKSQRVRREVPQEREFNWDSEEVRRADQKYQGILELSWDGATSSWLYPGQAGTCISIDRGSKGRLTGTVSGNCCWRIYTRRGCAGAYQMLVPGETLQFNSTAVRTAKLVEC